ncbi:hypothetical protein K7H99_21885 (plasmid) [Providencia rettgeri]|uniref:hypothetical protein n=1 Tax=Providencia rettgeri TaxID=587 RepID=UPI001CA6D24A|nr:hypothetical protein [Providencia rettgeri]QZY66767.1 hypothetical protein K7H99_21885 [Providencia rettgeri]
MKLFDINKKKQHELEIERLNREIEQLKHENKAYQQFVEQTYYYAGNYPAIKLVNEFRYFSPAVEYDENYAIEIYSLVQNYLYRYLTAYLTLLQTISPVRANDWEHTFALFLKTMDENIDKHPPRHLEQFNDFK